MNTLQSHTSSSEGQHVEVVLFDLLTAVLDSWTLWNDVAGSEEMGRRWRMAYLKLTYGCGRYVSYETLVEQAAASVGLDAGYAASLASRWGELRAWPEAPAVLAQLKQHYRLGVVTNCSTTLGHLAALIPGVAFDVVVTSEEAGFYKPDPAPYQLALDKLGVHADRAAFVAGSAYDLFGTAKLGLRTYWHNRVGLPMPDGAPAPFAMRPTLDSLPADLASLAATPR
ncbi:HAD-IA family hydrolase [Paraburkholderia flava]|uniref:HAD-IA family hydrolase n=1 Tax=Paraburkholderia flava TaxID=2547393 RepID=UPI00105E10D3|nr:HAD-IA family hydrolase [Paraburkholderia flava]